MKRLAAALVAMGAMAPTHGTVVQAQQAPVFRATADLVTVDVFVRDGGRPVTGLSAADFVLRDNGAVQRVESIEASRVPLDVSLLVDVSTTPNWWGRPRPPEDVAARLTDIVRRAAARLQPADRVRALSIDTYVREVLPFQPPGDPVVIDPSMATGGMSSLNDALVATLLQPPEPSRRRLVIAMTKAEDTISTHEIDRVQTVARHSDVVLHVVLGTSLIGNTACGVAVQEAAPAPVKMNVRDEGAPEESPESPRLPLPVPSAVNTCTGTRRFWQPVSRRVESALPALAESTGGAFHGFDQLGFYRNFGDELQRIFDQFRQGYVLRYTPQGDRRTGWHDIVVTVPANPGYVVQARRGYLVEPRPVAAPRDPAAPAARRSSPTANASMESLVVAFGRADYRGFEQSLASTPNLDVLLREVRTSPTPWPDLPRRDAVFALEMAIAGLNHFDEDTREEAMRLLEQRIRLVRQPLGADAFECTWYWTGTAALEGMLRSTVARTFITQALTRCQNEPRLHLAAAVVADQQWIGGLTGRGSAPAAGGPSPTERQELRRLYDVAMQSPATAFEARVRAAWFVLRAGDASMALALVDGASGSVADPQVLYLREFVRGQVLRELGRHQDAVAAFRAALTAWPRAQSARVALVALLVTHGDRAEAEALAEAIQTAPDSDFDPWWRYWQGDFRAFTGILARLREMAR